MCMAHAVMHIYHFSHCSNQTLAWLAVKTQSQYICFNTNRPLLIIFVPARKPVLFLFLSFIFFISVCPSQLFLFSLFLDIIFISRIYYTPHSNIKLPMLEIFIFSSSSFHSSLTWCSLFYIVMSRQASRRVSFSPDVYDKPIIYMKQGGGTRVGGIRNRANGILAFRLLQDPKSLSAPVRFLRGLRAKVVRVMSERKRSSRKVSSSNLTRSRSVSDPIESHRAEALEDCIEFLNSASSLQRSSSVTSNPC